MTGHIIVLFNKRLYSVFFVFLWRKNRELYCIRANFYQDLLKFLGYQKIKVNRLQINNAHTFSITHGFCCLLQHQQHCCKHTCVSIWWTSDCLSKNQGVQNVSSKSCKFANGLTLVKSENRFYLAVVFTSLLFSNVLFYVWFAVILWRSKFKADI